MRSLLILLFLSFNQLSYSQGFSLNQLVKFVRCTLPEVSDSMNARNWTFEGRKTDEDGSIYTDWRENYTKNKYLPAESFQYQQTKKGTSISYSTTVKRYYLDILETVKTKCKVTEASEGLSRYKSLNGKWRITILVSPADGPMKETYFIGVAIDE